MSKPFSSLQPDLCLLSEQLLDSLSHNPYRPPEASNVSIKSMLQSLLSPVASRSISESTELEIRARVVDFTLGCAALSSSRTATYEQLSWIPDSLSVAANSAFHKLSECFRACVEANRSVNEKRLLVELMPEALPLLKARIKESSIDKSEDGDEITAASARAPVAYAIVAAYQFRWFVTQVQYPDLGKLCPLVIPCALTTLDHWSPEVKGQGMISFIHLAKNVNAAELGWYDDVILDACCHNISSSDEIWEYEVEMSVLLVCCTQQCNPRSSWYEKMLNEMLSHLERRPRNKECRVAWMKHIEPLLSGLGLVLVAHFRRIFPLFFRWMHADDDETVLLVLDRIQTIVKLTWARNSPYIERLVDELVILYKEAALKIAREDIRARVIQILTLLQRSKGHQFEAVWVKHKDDPNLTALCPSLSERNAGRMQGHAVEIQ